MKNDLEDRFPYVVYYYIKNSITNIRTLTKKCFKDEQGLKDFLSNNNNYDSIDAVYRNEDRIKFEVKTVVELKE